MKENWKINIGGCVCFIGKRENGTQEVFFASPDKKTKAKNVVKLVESVSLKNFTEHWIDNYEDFSMKVGPRMTLLTKHPDFPDPEKWYPVRNWMLQSTEKDQKEQLGEYFLSTSLKKGEFEGKWVPLFDPELDKSVNFICESMPEWEEKQEEIIRRVNFEMGKKTTKWIPGHKYDSENNSFWYLGEVKTRIEHRSNSSRETFYWGNSTTNLELKESLKCFLSKAPTNPDNIWDNVVISMTREKGNLNYFDVLVKKPKVVDSGEWIPEGTNPWENPKEWRIGMITRTLENVCKDTKVFGGVESVNYYNLNYALEPLYLYLGEKDEPDMEKIGEYVNPILTPVILECFDTIMSYHFNDLDPKNAEGTLEDKVEKLVSNFISNYIRELFAGKRVLIEDLFKSLGNPLKKLAKDFLSTFELNNKLNMEWENYLKNVKYLENSVRYSHRYFDIRKKIKESYLKKNGLKEDHITGVMDKTLSNESISKNTRNLLVDMITWAKSNDGIGLTKYWVNKNNEVEINLTLKDIINRWESEGTDIPEDYKKGIMKDKLWKYTIIADSDTKWDEQ